MVRWHKGSRRLGPGSRDRRSPGPAGLVFSGARWSRRRARRVLRCAGLALARVPTTWRRSRPAVAMGGAAIPRFHGIPLGVASRRSPAYRLCRICRPLWSGPCDQSGRRMGVRPVLGWPRPGFAVVRAGVAAAQPDQNHPPDNHPRTQDPACTGAVPLPPAARLLARSRLAPLVHLPGAGRTGSHQHGCAGALLPPLPPGPPHWCDPVRIPLVRLRRWLRGVFITGRPTVAARTTRRRAPCRTESP
jgi:hypothetical protein